MGGPKSPCKDCEHRSPACHAICPVYKQFEQDREAFRKVVNHANEITNDAKWDYIYKRIKIKQKLKRR